MRSAKKSALVRALVRQVERLDRRLVALEARSRRFSWSRLGLVLGGGAVAWIAFEAAGNGVGALVLLAAFVAFVATAYRHNRVEKSIRRHRIWRQLKAGHLARMNLEWAALPLPPAHTPEAEHPFERDLNLTGPRSLHHLADTAVSSGGSARLRQWLLAPAPDAEALRRRQALVRELTPLSTFRDRLALNSALVTRDPEHRWEGDRLLGWLDRHKDDPRILRLLVLLGTLAGANIVLFALFSLGLLPPVWAFSFVLYMWVYVLRSRAFGHLFDEAEYLLGTLNQFRAVLLYLESYRMDRYPELARLCAPFRAAAHRPSRLLRRINGLALAASSQKSELLRLLLNVAVPWDLFFAYRLSRYKAQVRAVLPAWLDAWNELEALGSLAGFAYLNPDYTLPGVVAANEGGPLLEVQGAGHPLLPDALKVRNDFAVAHEGEITLITGSNMSGKSTFLRTLGMNLALAFAGGPVDAARMRTVPFRLFTCINVSDSVNDGISYFYAEVRRLKALLAALDAPHPDPVFFLIDEIFRGTNNRERLIGSRSFVRALTHKRGTGLLSTHDLELVHLADEVPGIRNVHFREEVEDGRMVFTYHLHEGPCPTTNALKIMRLEGLPLDPPYLEQSAAS